MNVEQRQYTLEDLSHEQIELHIQRAHELRNEAIVDMIRATLAGLRNTVRQAFARLSALVGQRHDVIKARQPTA